MKFQKTVIFILFMVLLTEINHSIETSDLKKMRPQNKLSQLDSNVETQSIVINEKKRGRRMRSFVHY